MKRKRWNRLPQEQSEILANVSRRIKRAQRLRAEKDLADLARRGPIEAKAKRKMRKGAAHFRAGPLTLADLQRFAEQNGFQLEIVLTEKTTS